MLHSFFNQVLIAIVFHQSDLAYWDQFPSHDEGFLRQVEEFCLIGKMQ